ncbi:hypothetical protein N7481_005381 [Penicillium waksmanii]|uniref:uncharacterized protein n=1 Tax=Penicillium waksmanii TaxID=69791 RepID=UPI002547110A|nr:uncharacterized protein N7481_005381 [Penicillium waksmanii]KAJ5983282.1 hypothetical protein N7481_005381 [Penicillium waksmanii]
MEERWAPTVERPPVLAMEESGEKKWWREMNESEGGNEGIAAIAARLRTRTRARTEAGKSKGDKGRRNRKMSQPNDSEGLKGR